MFKKLRTRFLLVHMGIVSLLVAVFFGSLLFINYNNVERSTDRRADMAWNAHHRGEFSFSVAEARPSQDAQRPPDRAIDSFYTVASGPSRPDLGFLPSNEIFITVDDAQQIVQVESPYEELDNTFYENITESVIKGDAARGGMRVNDVWLKYRREGNELLFIDVSPEFSFFYGMLTSFLMIALPLLAIIFLLSLFLSNRAIKPIEASFNRQKEFIADASHELKTPLAAITTNLDVLTGTAEPAQQKWLGYIHSEVRRMTSLTNSLLYLTKMDYGGEWENLPVDLGKLVEDVWLPLEAVLFEKGLTAETDLAEKITVNGDGEQLRKLIAILTDNAVRYAESHIRITLGESQNHALLRFENDGPGIPEAEREKIWERFYRGDRARQYDGGYGLGLPMAKTITERHKGKITCESRAGDGRTVFTVRLPL
ncbi:MAG: HAMP domain-containing histidine kinase [Clostridiales bacterium]|jgi:signal transduction histidine kinase|nr:HAMP domain-containing histidine kinase [Clostridiales bacterium]